MKMTMFVVTINGRHNHLLIKSSFHHSIYSSVYWLVCATKLKCGKSPHCHVRLGTRYILLSFGIARWCNVMWPVILFLTGCFFATATRSVDMDATYHLEILCDSHVVFANSTVEAITTVDVDDEKRRKTTYNSGKTYITFACTDCYQLHPHHRPCIIAHD